MQKKILLLICFVLFILQFVFYSCSSTPSISIDLKTQKEKREQVDVSKFLICQENFLIEQYNPDLKSSSYSSSNNSKADRTGNYIVGLLNIISLVEYFAELPDKCKFYEFDVSVSFEDISRKNYTFNRTYAVWASSKGNAKKELKKYYVVMSAASLIGLEGDYQTIKDKIKKVKVEYLDEREGEFTSKLIPKYLCFEEELSEKNYRYDFSANVDYEKKKAKKKSPAVRDTFAFNTASNLKILGAAAIDVQFGMWEQAKELGYKKTPVPNISFERSEKVSFVAGSVSPQEDYWKEEDLKSSSVSEQSYHDDTKKKSSSDSATENLFVLIEMYRDGLITEEEFKKAKEGLTK